MAPLLVVLTRMWTSDNPAYGPGTLIPESIKTRLLQPGRALCPVADPVNLAAPRHRASAPQRILAPNARPRAKTRRPEIRCVRHGNFCPQLNGVSRSRGRSSPPPLRGDPCVCSCTPTRDCPASSSTWSDPSSLPFTGTVPPVSPFRWRAQGDRRFRASTWSTRDRAIPRLSTLPRSDAEIPNRV